MSYMSKPRTNDLNIGTAKRRKILSVSFDFAVERKNVSKNPCPPTSKFNLVFPTGIFQSNLSLMPKIWSTTCNSFFFDKLNCEKNIYIKETSEKLIETQTLSMNTLNSNQLIWHRSRFGRYRSGFAQYIGDLACIVVDLPST